MPAIEPFVVFCARLEGVGLRYAITGSVAATFYGEPRMTHDVDLVLELPPGRCAALVDAFPEAQFYCPPLEVLRLEAARAQRGHFNLIDFTTGFKADVYLAGRDRLHAFALAGRREIALGDARVFIAPPEYVILRKLQFFREGQSEKHLRDVARMLVGLGPEWDRTLLNAEIATLGLGPEWARAAGFDEGRR